MINYRIKRAIAGTATVIFTALSIFSTPQNLITSFAATTTEWPKAPDVAATSAILIDADTGAVLYDKNSHTKSYPASITKLMTGLLTIENCSLNEVVTFSSTAANSVKWDEANIATKAGEQYTVEQSLHALLLSSANEVAYGLGEYVGGSLPEFVNMMNKRAAELGALNTHFNNASGLNDPNHYTTAYDMAMIGRAAFTNSTFLSIDSYTGYYKLGPTNLTPQVRSLYSSNLMFKGREYYYEYCKGSKTGYTDESGYTLVSYAVKDGMRLICVTMKESVAANRYIDTKALFEYGFNNFKKVPVSSSGISSLFNSSNYYNSRVYGNSSTTFSMNASYVDLPTSATFSDVILSVDDNFADVASSDKNYDYKAKLNFNYAGNIVGSADMTVTSDKNSIKSKNLPYLTDNDTAIPTAKKSIVVNIWYVVLTVAVILFIFKVITEYKRAKLKKRKKTYNGRKLRY